MNTAKKRELSKGAGRFAHSNRASSILQEVLTSDHNIVLKTVRKHSLHHGKRLSRLLLNPIVLVKRRSQQNRIDTERRTGAIWTERRGMSA